MTLVSEFIIDITNALDRLLNDIACVESCLQSEQEYAAWVDTLMENDTGSARDRACFIVRQIEYLPNQDPKTAITCPGIIAASQQTLNLIQQLNESKAQFKASIQALKKQPKLRKTIDLQQAIDDVLNKRNSNTRYALDQLGSSKLHLKQCYRALPILREKPKKVSWTWANTRSIKKITREEAEQRLIKKGEDESILIQLRKLASLSDHEQLAIVQDLAPHLRANIVYNEENSLVSRQMINAPIPILYPALPHEPLPEFRPPKIKQAKDQQRLIRSDTKLDPEPFLPAIRAHRYVTEPAN